MNASIQQRLEELQIIFKVDSVRKLALYFGIHPQVYYDLISGKIQIPSVKTLNAMAKKGVNTEWFQNGTGEPMQVITYINSSPISTISDSEMVYYAEPDLTKMTIEEMKDYYKTLKKHDKNLKQIEEVFKVLNIEL